MHCVRCSRQAVIESPQLCGNHFNAYVERTVKKTIAQCNLISDTDRVVVAASGGKDSLTVLHILAQLYPEISALAIDEGIAGYRENTLTDLKHFCQKRNIPLHIYSYEQEFGLPLDAMLRKHAFNPCALCGVFRRYLINTKARALGATKVATGHNLDDEAQAILMNLFKNNFDVLVRSGPTTGIVSNVRFVPRIKPLYFLTEKQIMAYAFMHGLTNNFNECPNTKASFRNYVRDWLNEIERTFPGSKMNVATHFIDLLPQLKQESPFIQNLFGCVDCGEPSTQERCHTCTYIEQLGLRGAQRCQPLLSL